MKRFWFVLVFFIMNSHVLFGMENNNQKPNWAEMYKDGKYALKVRLKNALEQSNLLSLSNMNLSCLDECDQLIELFNNAVLEVSTEELIIDISQDVIFEDENIYKIKALSVARNPNLRLLPDCLSCFVDLEKLIISFSGITTFQPVLLKLQNLKHLVLSIAQLNELVKDEKFTFFVEKLDFVTIQHCHDEPKLTDKAKEITKHKLLNQN